jgi:hypothetical protein
MPRRGSRFGSLILTRRRLRHLDDISRNPTRIHAEPLLGVAGEGPRRRHASRASPGGATDGGGGRREGMWWQLGFVAAREGETWGLCLTYILRIGLFLEL